MIALGGGGTIDIGKAISFLVTNGRGAWDYTVKENQFYYDITEEPIPLVAIPTTAGTGSEATIYSVINNPEIQRKCTIRSFALYPALAIIDPELMINLPPMLMALTGIDTFAHAFESFTNKNATLYSKMVAKESMKLFIRIMGNQRVTMKTYGMDENRADEFAEFIFNNYQKDMGNYLRVPTLEELKQIIHECL